MSTGAGPAIYVGTVTHRRLRPLTHALSYGVASVLVDVDDLAAGKTPALLSYNRFNLFSIHDRDHGDEDSSIRAFLDRHIAAAGLSHGGSRVLMLVYPRILGYAFNPLTTYYVLDDAGNLRLMIYEVHNTFGGRHTYVTRAEEGATGAYGTTGKAFRVSPFNAVEGHYGLRATLPGETLALGVSLTTPEGPLLKAYFTGRRRPLTTAGLLTVFARLPFQSLKVVGGIHWEALKLWRKGLKLHPPS
jgi:DUF1365 family protein